MIAAGIAAPVDGLGRDLGRGVRPELCLARPHESAVWSVADGIGLLCTLAVCWQSIRRGEVTARCAVAGAAIFLVRDPADGLWIPVGYRS